MMLISHEDIPQVSQEFMNITHAEDVDIINALFEEILLFEKGESSTEKVDALYQKWTEHTRRTVERLRYLKCIL